VGALPPLSCPVGVAVQAGRATDQILSKHSTFKGPALGRGLGLWHHVGPVRAI